MEHTWNIRVSDDFRHFWLLLLVVVVAMTNRFHCAFNYGPNWIRVTTNGSDDLHSPNRFVLIKLKAFGLGYSGEEGATS